VAAAHHVPRDIVGGDPVRALGGALGGRLLDNILGFRREADEQTRSPVACGKLGQNVARRLVARIGEVLG